MAHFARPSYVDPSDRILSVSQIETWDLCHRKWALGRLYGIQRKTSQSMRFGTALHSVLERYLSATPTGHVPEKVPDCLEGQTPGEPVELYPAGWDSELLPGEANEIEVLVEDGIRSGNVARQIGWETEKEIWWPICKGAVLLGKVDYSTENNIIDFKTARNTRYLKTAKALATDYQMSVYAGALLDTDWASFEYPESIKVAHVQFVRSDQKTRKVKSEISISDVEKALKHTKEAAANILTLIGSKPKDPMDVPGPNAPKACKKYGGCEFAQFCMGSVSLDRLREESRREEANANRMYPQLRYATRQEERMNLREKLLAKAKNKTAAPAPDPEPEPEPQSEPEAEPTSEAPLLASAQGTRKKPAFAAKAAAKLGKKAAVKKATPKKAAVTAAAEAPAAPPETGTVTNTEARTGAPKGELKRGPGKGVMLAINCCASGFEMVSKDITPIYLEAVARIESDLGKAFPQLDSWGRRDALAVAAVEDLEAGKFSGNIVYFAHEVPAASDFHAYVSELARHAGSVIRGIR